MSKGKLLIFGPINDFGGREIEAGFIAYALSSEYEVAICSTESLGKQSQVFTFNPNQEAFALNQMLCKKHVWIRLLALFNRLNNGGKGSLSKFAQNSISKKYFGYKKKAKRVLHELLAQQDLIFICGQLSSNYVSDVVKFAKKNNKKLIFRTTGTISNPTHYSYLDKIDCFIHHSASNAGKIDHLPDYKYEIIDQCAFNETELSKLRPHENNCQKFLVLTRLSPEKGVEQIIDYFLRCCAPDDVLYIAGNGSLETLLKNKFQQRNIRFLGFVESDEFVRVFADIDCLIIPSPEESGPLVGVEAMCAGKVIISTVVGAMPERLSGTLNDFWYECDNFESFAEVFQNVKQLTESERMMIFKSLTDRYHSEYTIQKIGRKYLNIVKKIMA